MLLSICCRKGSAKGRVVEAHVCGAGRRTAMATAQAFCLGAGQRPSGVFILFLPGICARHGAPRGGRVFIVEGGEFHLFDFEWGHRTGLAALQGGRVSFTVLSEPGVSSEAFYGGHGSPPCGMDRTRGA
ncbi:hypothetical protein TraAM80_09733 [Trypanosoma rangeli]|uniref:Uncharacterized protein n=1 Tax=Trypanosoma rangeli TaxID=5698 RepID=A0A422MU65_TRYRA|nr:uncharacterized protein TraAM80_09733 [Trypanosoma rangeli]RNE96731.1 hypothetical protein TraAM80_09733 [Trypanosoma rangeli]|eukprot:RNE96731.1 hypothetical protein TraAM80_09733 [Trypanosoma rangeli]